MGISEILNANQLRLKFLRVRSAYTRVVAQVGSAPRSGRGGRGFKSRLPDKELFCDRGFSLRAE